MADALVAGTQERGLRLATPSEAQETFGRGIRGVVEGHRLIVGSLDWVRDQGILTTAVAAAATANGGAVVAVAVDGELAGLLLVDDRIRDDATGLAQRLRDAGIDHVALVTGDNAVAANRIGAALDLDRVYADQSPEQKLEVVRMLQGAPPEGGVVMVGDGINDAPALALADVGIALGTLGATVASETADVVILVNRIDRVVDAIHIGRRSLSIARQSVLIGLGASFVAMVFAAAGLLPPTSGALLQEGIDVAVILNALRAGRG
jgi:P-type E1-E2 ATPase